jgi:DNA repair photolyase
MTAIQENSTMGVINMPAGAAKEYSPRSINLRTACGHKCNYCFAPQTLRKKREDYNQDNSELKKDVVERIRKELESDPPTEQVMLSFAGDVYDLTADTSSTREVLKLLLEHKVPVGVLTKGGRACLRDLDVFKQFGKSIIVGATLTYMDEAKSLEVEPGAALPEDRLTTLKKLHDEGVSTFVSFEPVLDPEQTLKLIERCLEDGSVDLFKVGRWNHDDKANNIDWPSFLLRALVMLRSAGARVYIKDDLHKACPGVKLESYERDATLHYVGPDGLPDLDAAKRKAHESNLKHMDAKLAEFALAADLSPDEATTEQNIRTRYLGALRGMFASDVDRGRALRDFQALYVPKRMWTKFLADMLIVESTAYRQIAKAIEEDECLQNANNEEEPKPKLKLSPEKAASTALARLLKRFHEPADKLEVAKQMAAHLAEWIKAYEEAEEAVKAEDMEAA